MQEQDNSGGRGVAVVGAGYWGRNIVRNVAQLGRLSAIVDSSASVRERFERQHPDVLVTDDLDAVLADPSIGGVMVVVPAPGHFEVAQRVIAAGKQTYVEKPLALSAEQGRQLVAQAREKGVQLMVGHLLLYHPCVQFIRRTIDRDELGDVLYLHSQRVNLGKVRTDENAMWSLAPHDISVALYLLEETPVRVSAQGFCYLQKDSNIHDVVFLTLAFADGRAAHIHVSWLDPHKRRRFTVVGSQKMLTFDDMSASEKVRIYDKGVGVIDGQDYESYAELLTLRQGDVTIPHIPMREPLRTLCEDFLAAVDAGKTPLADGVGGAAVLEVLEAAQRSLNEGGAVVDVASAAGAAAS